MKSTLQLFGATLDQVCVAARERFGAGALATGSAELSAELAMTAARSRLAPGLKALTTALAVAASGAPALAQSIVVDEGVRTPASVSADGRTEGNTAARLAGGVAGGLIGNSLARNAVGLPRAAAVLGLAYVGQSIGDIMTRNTTDQQGRPVVRAGTDSRGRPVYQTLGEPLRQGSDMDPVHVTREAYEQALAKSSAPAPAPGATHRRSLDTQTHAGLYALMVEAAASRAVAAMANRDLDQAELARAVAPRDAQKAAAFSQANRNYAQAFQTYATSYRQASEAIALADRNGFDVSAQMLLMGTMPADLRRAPGVAINWPGVDYRIRELGSRMQLDQSASYAEVSALGSQRPERQRGF